MDGTLYPVNVQDQSDLAAIDLMVSDKVDDNSREDVQTFTFGHKLSKLTLNLYADEDGIKTIDGLEAGINGMYTTADYDIVEYELTNYGEVSTAANFAFVMPEGVAAGLVAEAVAELETYMEPFYAELASATASMDPQVSEEFNAAIESMSTYDKESYDSAWAAYYEAYEEALEELKKIDYTILTKEINAYDAFDALGLNDITDSNISTYSTILKYAISAYESGSDYVDTSIDLSDIIGLDLTEYNIDIDDYIDLTSAEGVSDILEVISTLREVLTYANEIIAEVEAVTTNLDGVIAEMEAFAEVLAGYSEMMTITSFDVEAIVIPQTLSEGSASFWFSSPLYGDFEIAIPETTFEQGKSYIYNITLTEAKIVSVTETEIE